MADPVAADERPLSVDQAAGLLGSLRAQAPQTAETPEPDETEAPEPAAVEDTESEGETTPEEPSEPEEVTDEPDEEAEDAEDPPIPAPQSWSAADKELFAKAPREIQEVLLRRETDRDKAVQRSVQEASDAKRQAEEAQTQAKAVTDIMAVLEQIVPAAQQTFQSKWANWTPENQLRMSREHPNEYTALRAAYEAEMGEMARLEAVNQQTRQTAYQQFVRDESAKLATLAPELADPKEGVARREALGSYLTKEGVPQDQIPLLDANTIRLAHKAMKYDELQAKAATSAQPSRPAPARAAPPVRPGGAAAPAPSRTRSADAALDRLSREPTIDNAVAAMRARRTR